MINNLYDILNIGGNSIEENIKKAISETKNTLNGLTEDRTCIIYSNYLYDNLVKKHVVCRKMNTKEMNYNYEHHFILVPINSEESYIIDLTFSQFRFPFFFSNLLENGYQKVSNLEYNEYLEIITGENKITTDDKTYTNTNRNR